MRNKRRSVVFLSETMPLGGTSTFAMNVCSGLLRFTDWNGVAAALTDLGEIGVQIRDAGLPVFGPDANSVLHEERIETMYEQCAKISPSAVVAALSACSFDFLRFVPEDCLRVGMIQTDEEGVYQLVERYLPWLDVVVGVSLEICRKIENRLGGRRIPVVHQPYGVPMPATEHKHPGTGPLRILYLGRLIEEQKRVSLLIKVIDATLRSGSNLEWIIAGDGPDLNSMRNHFAGSEKVKILGNVPYADVPRVIHDCDVYFLCSDYEGLPLSLLESMGAGLIPVVSDLPSGISEVVNERNGIRIAIQDEQGYVRALVALASDTNRRASLSSAARMEVRLSHSTEAMAERWRNMLDQHLSGNEPIWKSRIRATAPLGYEKRWLFHPTLRPLRSASKRIRLWAQDPSKQP